MKRNVYSWASFCALIGISLALISCGKQTDSAEAGLPDPTSSLAGTTTGYSPVVMVAMPNGVGICSGTFISTRAVLTASHCTRSESGTPLNGTYTVYTSQGQIFSTTTYVAYGPGVVADPNDIALLIFNKDVVDASQVYALASKSSTGDTITLVGYGCTNLSTKVGAGLKRAGTNVIASIDDYVNFVTPNADGALGILGPSNRSGSCFGDSGGPALEQVGSTYEVAAVTHAGGTDGTNIDSEYIDVSNRADNRGWLSAQDQAYNLGIQGL